MILINEIHLVSIEVILFVSFINFYHQKFEIINSSKDQFYVVIQFIDNVSQYLMKQYVY